MSSVPTPICTARVPRMSLRNSYIRNETTAMSTRSHQPIGGRRRMLSKKSTMHGIAYLMEGGNGRVGLSSGGIVFPSHSNPVSDPDDVNHFSDLMYTDDMSSAKYAGGDGGRRGPFPPS